jgi:hypothetical protein
VADAILVLLFAGLLVAPTVRNLLGPPPAAASENRALAPWPKWQASAWAAADFPSRFEAFYNDHFGFRYKLIDWHNHVRVRYLGLSSSPQVCLGKEGWLYFQHEPLGNDAVTDRPFTKEELQRWQRMLESRRDWLAERGISYLFVVAPNKESIYPEMLPSGLRRRGHSSRLDQLLAHLQATSRVRVLDLRGPLRTAKAHERVYHVTDSHWNQSGAYVAYYSLVNELAQDFPQLQPMPRSAFAESSVQLPGGDLAKMLGMAEQFSEEHPLLIPRLPRQARQVEAGLRLENLPSYLQPTLLVRPEPDLPRAVLFHDSFAQCFTPFLGEHFQRMSCRWLEAYEFDVRLIESEKPDIVIQEIVERKLDIPFPPHCRAGGDEDLDATPGWPYPEVSRVGNANGTLPSR